METITVTDLRQQMDTLLHRVRLRGESFLITKSGKEVAVLLPIKGIAEVIPPTLPTPRARAHKKTKK